MEQLRKPDTRSFEEIVDANELEAHGLTPETSEQPTHDESLHSDTVAADQHSPKFNWEDM